MKKLFFTLFTVQTLLIPPAFAEKRPTVIETVSGNVLTTLYAFKKTRHYTAVEIGFTNPTNDFIEFTPQEIYLDDAVKYSLQPLTINEITAIQEKDPGLSLVPLALGVGLGIGTLGAGIAGHGDLAEGLGIAAVSMAGAYILTKGLENQIKENRLIRFENNNISNIKRLPPGMTLGGLLFFPATKKPKSITIIAKSKSGEYEKKVIALSQIKKR